MWHLHSGSDTAQHLYLRAAKGSEDTGLILPLKGVQITLPGRGGHGSVLPTPRPEMLCPAVPAIPARLMQPRKVGDNFSHNNRDRLIICLIKPGPSVGHKTQRLLSSAYG